MASKFGNNTFDFSLNDVIVDLGRYWEAGLIGSGLAELDGLASKEANEVEETKGKNAGRPGDEVAKEVLKVLSN